MRNSMFREVTDLLKEITHNTSSKKVEVLAMEARDVVISKTLRNRLLDFADNPAHFEEYERFLEQLIRELKLELK